MPPNSPPIPARELDIIRRWVMTGSKQHSSHELSPAMGSTDKSESATAPRQAELATIRSLFQPAAITSLDGHPSRSLVAVAGLGQACLVDTETGQLLGAYDISEGEVTAVRFSRDGRLLLVASGIPGLSGKVTAFDLETHQKQFEIADENDSILAFDLSPSGKRLAVGGPKKIVHIYDISTNRIVQTLRKHTDWVLTLSYSSDGVLLASGDRFGGIYVWDAVEGELFHTLRGHEEAVHDLAWDSDSETLITVGEDGTVRTWNMHHGEETSQWQASEKGITALSRGTNITFTGSRLGELASWLAPEQQAHTGQAGEQIECMSLANKGGQLVVGDSHGRVHILNADNLERQHVLQLPVNPQGKQQFLKQLATIQNQFESTRLAESKPELKFATESTPFVDQSQGNPITSPDGLVEELRTLLAQAEIHADSQRKLVEQSEASVETMTALIQSQQTVLSQLQKQASAWNHQMDQQKQSLAEAEQQIVALQSVLGKVLSSKQGSPAARRKQLEERLLQQKRVLKEAIEMQKALDHLKQLEIISPKNGRSLSLARQLASELANVVEATQQELAEFQQEHKTSSDVDSSISGVRSR